MPSLLKLLRALDNKVQMHRNSDTSLSSCYRRSQSHLVEEIFFFICLIYTILYRCSAWFSSSVTNRVEYRVQVIGWPSIDFDESSLYCFHILFILEAFIDSVITRYDNILRSHLSPRSLHFPLKWITIGPLLQMMSQYVMFRIPVINKNKFLSRISIPPLISILRI